MLCSKAFMHTNYFQDQKCTCTSVVSMEFPSFFKCLEFVRCTSNSATLLMLTDANGDDTGALNNVFRVGRNASSTSSWFVLDGAVHNRSNKCNPKMNLQTSMNRVQVYISSPIDNGDNADSNNNGVLME